MSKELDRPVFTGERVTPDIIQAGPGDLLAFLLKRMAGIPIDSVFSIREEHLARYRFVAAMGLVQGKRVLDLACGTGYGTKVLRNEGKAKEVFGIDIDPQATFWAKKDYGRFTQFVLGDGRSLPFPNQGFDVVVSFETIEHVLGYKEFLGEISRVLVPEGTLVLSTPNRTLTNPGQTIEAKPKNKYHVFEFSRAELVSELGTHFQDVVLYGQRFMPQSAVEPEPPAIFNQRRDGLKMEALKLRHRALEAFRIPARSKVLPSRDGQEPLYLVVVCQNSLGIGNSRGISPR